MQQLHLPQIPVIKKGERSEHFVRWLQIMCKLLVHVNSQCQVMRFPVIAHTLNQYSRIFGILHDLWTILTANVTYTKSQNYTNMVIDKRGVQTLKVVVVVLELLLLLFGFFCPHKCTSHTIFGQVVCPNINNCQLLST